MAERLQAIVKASTPALSPRTWYSMPTLWPGRQCHLLLPRRVQVQGQVPALGFSDKANLEEGAMWPTYYALTELTAADEERIAALVKKAVS
jgi:hypothetical protein